VKTLPTGIYVHGAGYRAIVSRGRGQAHVTRHFDRSTPIRVMVTWREDTKAQLRVTRKQRAFAGSFEADAKRYLEAVAALGSIKERRADIARWVEIFGTKRRDMITAAEIRLHRDRWITLPRGYAADGSPLPPYSASTINHRLRALSNLWTVLDGRRAPNPVREVPEVPEPDPLPRGLPYATVEAILSHLVDRGQTERGKGRKPILRQIRRARSEAERRRLRALAVPAPPPSKTLPRLRVMAYTGLTPAQLGRVVPSDLDLDAEQPSLLIRRRAKGKGAKPRREALLPQAVEAFRLFVARGCFGRFSASSVRKSFLIACRRARAAGHVIPEGVRPYDLRHSFGSMVFAATNSLEATQRMLSHEKRQTTMRYALSGLSAVQASNLKQIIDSKLLT
jgi:integrase